MSLDTATCLPWTGKKSSTSVDNHCCWKECYKGEKIHVNNIDAIIEPLLYKTLYANVCCRRVRGKYFLGLLSCAPLVNQWTKLVWSCRLEILEPWRRSHGKSSQLQLLVGASLGVNWPVLLAESVSIEDCPQFSLSSSLSHILVHCHRFQKSVSRRSWRTLNSVYRMSPGLLAHVCNFSTLKAEAGRCWVRF